MQNQMENPVVDSGGDKVDSGKAGSDQSINCVDLSCRNDSDLAQSLRRSSGQLSCLNNLELGMGTGGTADSGSTLVDYNESSDNPGDASKLLDDMGASLRDINARNPYSDSDEQQLSLESSSLFDALNAEVSVSDFEAAQTSCPLSGNSFFRQLTDSFPAPSPDNGFRTSAMHPVSYIPDSPDGGSVPPDIPGPEIILREVGVGGGGGGGRGAGGGGADGAGGGDGSPTHSSTDSGRSNTDGAGGGRGDGRPARSEGKDKNKDKIEDKKPKEEREENVDPPPLPMPRIVPEAKLEPIKSDHLEKITKTIKETMDLLKR
ncbi:MAG: hypothetical protein K2X93_09100 [Candidatus Obscuribacterales bacterium]|nr:hypothetical protein [Candidatus Obscuribacterales bacterium]